MRKVLLPFTALLLVVACGTTEEESPAPEPAEAAEELEPPPPPPEPEPEPEPVASCPADTWSVATNGGDNQAAEDGVEAAGLARGMGGTWESFRACRSIDDFEHLLSCAPVQGGAECSVSLPEERCSATLPGPTLAVAVGQFVDTHAVPSEGSWSCSPR